ncbi:hypothetical protein V6N13_007887 [Hibiscus sabdariffa]
MLFVSIAPSATTRATIFSVADFVIKIFTSYSQISVSSYSFVCCWLGLPTSNFVGLHGRFDLDLESSVRSSTVGWGFIQVAQLSFCFMVSNPPSLLSSSLYFELLVCDSDFRVVFFMGLVNLSRSSFGWVCGCAGKKNRF